MKPVQKIRLMFVDDHFLLRIGLATSLSVERDIVVVAEANDGEEAVKLFRQHQPDVTVMDWRLPGLSGVETAAAIRREFPDARIVMLSIYDGEEDIYRAMQAGAMGYLLKSAKRETLLEAIRAVNMGKRFMQPEVASKLAERVAHIELSEREEGVLRLIVKGLSNKEIASALSLAEITVKIHVSSVLNKLQVQDRTQAVTVAIRRGLVHLE
jgi:DNA-binding NarL/FixJ family response regulator